MVVQYARGGFITRHDHAFEEGFFFLEGEIEAELDGEVHGLEAGDYCWSGVRSMHAFANRAEQPVRWLETQVPQPPSRYQARSAARRTPRPTSTTPVTPSRALRTEGRRKTSPRPATTKL